MSWNSKSSVSARIYRWFYVEKKEEMTNNLCPYFWSSLFMWIVIIPYTLFSLPMVIAGWFGNSDDYNVDNPWQRIGFSFLLYAAILCVWSLIFVPYFLYVWGDVDAQGFWEFLGVLGGVLWFIGILVGGYHLLQFIGRKTIAGVSEGIHTVSVQPKTTMIREFVKAKYNKYCPKIDWKE